LNKMLGTDTSRKNNLCCASADSRKNSLTSQCPQDDITSINENQISHELVHRSVSDNSEEIVMFRRRRGSQIVRQRPLSVAITGYKEKVPCISNKRPLSCYVKSQSSSPPKEPASAFQKKLRRMSATVKNFSLEKLIHQRKLPPHLKGDLVTERLERKEKRKSLPPNFRFANGELGFSTPHIRRKVGVSKTQGNIL